MPINEDETTLMIYFSNKRMANLIMMNAPKNAENPLKKHHVFYCYRCHHIGCLANYICMNARSLSKRFAMHLHYRKELFFNIMLRNTE